MGDLRVCPMTLKEANEYVDAYHRHHAPAVGHKFSVGVRNSFGEVVGVAIMGRPVARMVDQGKIIEVVRLATQGERNVCSMLYSTAARAAAAMGYEKIQTYTLLEENGASLRASGWTREAETVGGSWTRASKPGRRQDQPLGPKVRWARQLRPARREMSPLEAIIRRMWHG